MSATKRLTSSLRWDVQLQIRYGFYIAAVVMMFVWLVILSQIEITSAFTGFIAFFLLTNLNLGTFLFIGGIMLFEKTERTIDAIIVTPIRFSEYMSSKIISLTILALVENFIIVLLIFRSLLGFFDYVLIFLSIVIMAATYILFGFAFVVKYKSLNEFLFPAIFAIFFLELPVFQFLGLDSTFWTIAYFLTPMQPVTLLATGVTGSLLAWQWIAGIIGSAFWLVVGWYLARRQYTRHIIRRLSL